jgi:hypothetical protein
VYGSIWGRQNGLEERGGCKIAFPLSSNEYEQGRTTVGTGELPWGAAEEVRRPTTSPCAPWIEQPQHWRSRADPAKLHYSVRPPAPPRRQREEGRWWAHWHGLRSALFILVVHELLSYPVIMLRCGIPLYERNTPRCVLPG